jgi:DNA-binding MarR family transcriptional regulator
MADDIGSARRAGGTTLGEPLFDMAGLEGTLGFRLRLAQQQVFRDFAARFAALDLNPVLYSALVLIERNRRCRQSELAAALGIRQPNMVDPIDTLVQRGLVSRSPDPDDRRANSLTLTPAGKKFMARLHATHDQHTRHLKDQLGDEEYELLVRLLDKLG